MESAFPAELTSAPKLWVCAKGTAVVITGEMVPGTPSCWIVEISLADTTG